MRKSIVGRYRGGGATGGRISLTKSSDPTASGGQADADAKTALPTAIKRMDSSVFGQGDLVHDPKTSLQNAIKKMAATDW